MTDTKPIRQAIIDLLAASEYPLTSTAIAKALNLTVVQVRGGLRGIRSTGRLMNDVSNEGTVYSVTALRPPIIPSDKSKNWLGPLRLGKKPEALKAKDVIYPPGVKVTVCPSPTYEKLTPAEWEHARPEGRDHEKTPSRRGDELVGHMPPIAMCVGGR